MNLEAIKDYGGYHIPCMAKLKREVCYDGRKFYSGTSIHLTQFCVKTRSKSNVLSPEHPWDEKEKSRKRYADGMTTDGHRIKVYLMNIEKL